MTTYCFEVFEWIGLPCDQHKSHTMIVNIVEFNYLIFLAYLNKCSFNHVWSFMIEVQSGEKSCVNSLNQVVNLLC